MIKDNVARIRERVAGACSKAKRDPAEVKIVAVSKARSVGEIEEAFSCGITDIGENKVQEALDKFSQLTINGRRPTAVKWHMVGHLQANKAKEAVKIFDLIHSVDSLRLAEKINAEAGKINKVQDILLEVKTSEEASKTGFPPDAVGEAVKWTASLRNIRLRGLMTIAALHKDPENSRPYFRALKDLRNKIYGLRFRDYDLGSLSMGMTGDFEVAIEEGADIIRIGRGIFGELKDEN